MIQKKSLPVRAAVELAFIKLNYQLLPIHLYSWYIVLGKECLLHLTLISFARVHLIGSADSSKAPNLLGRKPRLSQFYDPLCLFQYPSLPVDIIESCCFTTSQVVNLDPLQARLKNGPTKAVTTWEQSSFLKHTLQTLKSQGPSRILNASSIGRSCNLYKSRRKI